MITLTNNAVSAVQRLIQNGEHTYVGLRIKVEGGGCSGYRYGMRLEKAFEEDDEVVELPGLTVLIDSVSAPLLLGVTVDFVDALEGSGFRFENPNAAGGCSCGKSFSC
jgi:iron-sulfur cluster assembly protein